MIVMPTLTDPALTVVVLASAAAVILLAVALAIVAVRFRNLRRAYAAVIDDDRREDLFEALQRHLDDVQRLREDVRIVHRNTERLRDLLRVSVSHVGVVRYDAFDDMGGALSFSAAMLDEEGNGLVVSAINGRSEARTYAKPVVGGRSDFHLTPEEEEAIAAALSGEKGVATTSTRRSRRRAS